MSFIQNVQSNGSFVFLNYTFPRVPNIKVQGCGCLVHVLLEPVTKDTLVQSIQSTSSYLFFTDLCELLRFPKQKKVKLQIHLKKTHLHITPKACLDLVQN